MRLIKDDVEIVRTAVGQNGLALQYACEDLCVDLEVLRTALKQDPTAIIYVPTRFRRSEEFQKLLSENFPSLLEHEAMQFAPTL